MSNLSEWVEFNPRVVLEKGKDYPFLSMERIRPGIRYVVHDEYRSFTGGGARFCHGDTLFARITPCLENGKIAQFVVDPETCGFGSTEFFVLRAKVGISDPAFVYYLAKSDLLRSTAIQSMVGASGRQRADIESLRNLILKLPNHDEQKRIGQILSLYDDLIETNRRRIALLEEAARLLYREWFVNLRFPGYEQSKVVDGLPVGWSRQPLSALIEESPKTPFEKDKIYPFVPMQSLSESSMVIGAREEREISGGAKFHNLDTLLARITPCLENGKTGFVQFLSDEFPVASGSTEFIVMRSKSVSPYWVYCLAREDSFRDHAIRSMAGADGRQRVKTKCFDTYMTLQPPASILQEFDAIMEPLFSEVEILARQNVRLQVARDELLPKLMSGAIQV
ncbi:restriction endonuclease subunit S [Sulfuriferula sp.]|uniref:restriction endonuclease subunit S n=1 Tax=Sulfuriferula sp. TaxID=2025307 RepID=UPI002730D670|nr:restriction endonuclease subunit S [Sulfuriferula sp.]MDP2026881.1 restriction endonuclease subunit S [Sulfuriferula sp.]